MKNPIGILLLALTAGLGATTTPESGRDAAGGVTVPQDGSVEIAMPRGGTLADFLAEYARATGERVVYEPRWLEGQKIESVGSLRLPRDRAGAALRSILRAQGWVLMPVGAPELELRTLHRIDSMNRFRENAVHVELVDLLAGGVEDALIVTAVVPLEHANASSARNSLTGMHQDHQRSHVTAIPDANALVITSFADAVRSLAEVLLEADRLAGSMIAKNMERAEGAGGD